MRGPIWDSLWMMTRLARDSVLWLLTDIDPERSPLICDTSVYPPCLARHRFSTLEGLFTEEYRPRLRSSASFVVLVRSRLELGFFLPQTWR